MAKDVNWEQIKTEYITTDITFDDLSEKYKVSYSTLAKRAAREKWKELRKEHGKKVAVKTIEKSASKRAAELTQELDTVDEFLKMLKDSVGTDTYKCINPDGSVSDRLSVQKIKDAAQAMSKLIELKRLISGYQTVGEEQAYKIASERLELERKKIESGISADKDIKIDFPDEMKEWLV